MMAKSNQIFNAQAANDQAWADLLAATKTKAVLDALARGLWAKDRKTACPPNRIPNANDIMVYGAIMTDDQIDRAIKQLYALMDWIMSKSFRSTQNISNDGVACHTLTYFMLKRFAVGEQNRQHQFLPVNRAMQRVHRAWVKARTDGYKGKTSVI